MPITRTLMTPRAVLGARLETTPGTQIALDVAYCAWIVFNLKHRTLTTKTARPHSDTDGQHPSVRGIKTGELSFQIELEVGSRAPAVAETFFPMMGLGRRHSPWRYQIDRTLPSNPLSTCKTATLGFYEDGVVKYLVGAMANGVFHFLPDDRVLIDVTATGKERDEAGLALPEPTYPTPTLARWAGTSALAFDSYAPFVSMLDLDLGNQIVMRPDPNAADSSGISYFHVGAQMPKGVMDPERNPVSEKDLFGEWLAGNTSAFALRCVSGVHTCDFAMTKAEWQDIEDLDREGKACRRLGFTDNNHDLTVTFDADTATPTPVSPATPSPTPTP